MTAPFLRTSRGLSNQAVFLKVDAVVYSEGGRRGFSLEELEQGGGENNTTDAAFWVSILRLYAPHQKFEVRSVGSKTTVKAVAELVAAGAVTRVVATLDRDFDHRRGTLILHPNVMYTSSYSWENDVFSVDVASELIRDLLHSPPLRRVCVNHLDDAARHLGDVCKALVELDNVLASSGRELTLRDEVEKAVRLDTHQPPRLLSNILEEEVTRCRNQKPPIDLGLAGPCSVHCDLYGHALAKWWKGHLNHLFRTFTNVRLNGEALNALAISIFLRSTSLICHNHYRAKVEALTIVT